MFAVRSQDREPAYGGADGRADQDQVHKYSQDHLVRMRGTVDEIVGAGEYGLVEEEPQDGRDGRVMNITPM